MRSFEDADNSTKNPHPRPEIASAVRKAGGVAFVEESWHSGGVMKREFTVVIERDEDGYYVASVPELRGCHTQAKSLDALMKRIREAIELCLEVEADLGTRGEFVGVQRITV
jgi:predicted RNase H-like HicB family nuclease